MGLGAPGRRRMNENDNDPKPGNPWTRNLLIWGAIIFGLVLFAQMIGGGSSSANGKAIPYSDFVRQVEGGNVQSVTMATGATGNAAISGKLDTGEAFHTVAPADAN